MAESKGQFNISFAGTGRDPRRLDKDRIFIGRLDTCEIFLDHKTVSRIHAGINFRSGTYHLVNLSSSSVLTLNGRILRPEKDDALADGDTIQIGPYTIIIGKKGPAISLHVQGMVADKLLDKPVAAAPSPKPDASAADVLKVFWEKRSREKEDWGTRLRPTEKPKPGKAMFNWKPTDDLKRTWRFGLFIWAFLIIGGVGVFAFFKAPNVYSPKPLASAHANKFETSVVAAVENGNSCTTCHTANEPLENSCIKCHRASEFHVSNTKAHEQAGITCTVCHREHQGTDFQMVSTAIDSCASCHNDSNTKTYNGKSVRTPHGGSYGYPVVDGKWAWKGVYREVADAIPEINSSATGDKDEQARISRQFHTIHVYRLKAPEGVKGDTRGLVSCSSCHKSFDPIDRTTPRETSAACHATTLTPAPTSAPASAPASADNGTFRDQRFGNSPANCISCHVQHPYSTGRWNEFLTADALQRRKDVVVNQIKGLGEQ